MALLVAAALPASTALYSVRLEGGSDLDALVAEGVSVRHLTAREAVAEGDEALRTGLERAGFECIPLPGAAEGEDLFLCYPRSSTQSPSEFGRVVWSEPHGAFIVAAEPDRLDALRAVCFHVRPLPAAVDAVSWFDNRRPAHVAARDSRDELEVRGLVEDVLASVSSESLMMHVERLSRRSDGTSRSRYTLRDDCLTEAVPYITDKLSAYLPSPAAIDTHRFSVRGYSCENDTLVLDYPAENIVGTLPGSGRLGGCYVLCAHYDATASNSFSHDIMWWCDNPAPGADDNATGVATVLEAARVLSGVTYPFDVRFVLFSGEELGLLGSQAYADSVAAAGDTIYGVVNVDMVAYKLSAGYPDTCHIVTNPGTAWLADWIVDTAGGYPGHFDNFSVSRIDKPLAYSDHAPFWMNGYDALAALEHWDPRDRNPYYHTVGDTLGHVYETQLAAVGRLIAASMARLADTSSLINLAVFPGDIAFEPSSPDIGDHVDVSVKVHVFGPEEHVDMRLEVWDGAPGSGNLLSSLDVERTMGGGEAIRHDFGWAVGAADLGEHEITALIQTEDTAELTEADNEASTVVRVSHPDDLFVMDHYAYPNPGAADELNIRYELSRGAAAIYVEVFDLTGQLIGSFVRGIQDADAGTAAGWNTLALHRLGSEAENLASGVYVYRLRVYAEGISDPADIATGKFAVVR